MKLTEKERHEFIDDGLYHELRCLLGAATVWEAFKAADAGFDVVVAMDSAFVHARCLFNFFTAKGGNDMSIREFGVSGYVSDVYRDWEEPLHRHVLHIAKGRLSPNNVRDGAHLNEQVRVFADEILELWKELEKDSTDFAQVLAEVRRRAIRDASNDAAGRIVALFTG